MYTGAVFSFAGPRNGASWTRRYWRCTFLQHTPSYHWERRHWYLFWRTYLIVGVGCTHANEYSGPPCSLLFTHTVCLARHRGGNSAHSKMSLTISQRDPLMFLSTWTLNTSTSSPRLR